MPELPEVETIRRQLAPWLPERRIVTARRVDAPPGPKYHRLEQADGRAIQAVRRRGKYLILPLVGEVELVIHLGMTGRIRQDRPEHHLRVELALSGPAPNVLYFEDTRRFGRFRLVEAGDYRELGTLHHLGPEPFDPALTVEHLWQGLKSSRQAVKTRLLGQRVVAGLGNIYVDELLWRIRVHPARPSRRVRKREVRALLPEMRSLLEASIGRGGTTFSDYRTVAGQEGAYRSHLQVYGRQDQPCLRCGTGIQRIRVGQRGTHFCPTCQS